jgi:hypothetical protein
VVPEDPFGLHCVGTPGMKDPPSKGTSKTKYFQRAFGADILRQDEARRNSVSFPSLRPDSQESQIER